MFFNAEGALREPDTADKQSEKYELHGLVDPGFTRKGISEHKRVTVCSAFRYVLSRCRDSYSI